MIVAFNPVGQQAIGNGYAYVFQGFPVAAPPSAGGDDTRLQLGYAKETFIGGNPNLGGF